VKEITVFAVLTEIVRALGDETKSAVTVSRRINMQQAKRARTAKCVSVPTSDQIKIHGNGRIVQLAPMDYASAKWQ
jgi:hypothetical protein